VFAALRAANGTKAADATWSAYVASAFPAGSDDARLARNLLAFGPEARWPAPTAGDVIPYDRAPQSAPGERILFNCEFTPGGTSAEYHEQVFTATQGGFDSAGGAATKTVQGLVSGNVSFFVPAAWDGTSDLSVTLRVRPRGTAAATYTTKWTFAKKGAVPTTITQSDGQGELELGHTFTYTLGPAIRGKTAPYYEHQTILERFDGVDCNIVPGDLKPAFKTAHPGLTDSKAIAAHFFGAESSNGTFTVNHDDKIFDGHTGIRSQKADVEPALTTWKEIHFDKFQVYETKPGTAVGKFTIRRIIKADGSLKLRKIKTG
jgi:hypothetical protein